MRFAQAATLAVAGLTALRRLRFGGALIAEGSLKPRIGVERNWRDLLAVGEHLRERPVAGKAVLTIDGV